MAKTITQIKKERKALKQGKDMQALQLANNAQEMQKRKQSQSGYSEVRRTRDQTDYEKMKASSFIDTTQSSAGDYLRQLYHASHYGVPAMDPSKEPVDGGKLAFEIPDHVIDAQNKIGRLSRHLGPYTFAVVYKFVCEDKSARDIAIEFGDDRPSDRALKSYRVSCREGLEDAAEHLNYRRVTSRRSHYMRSEAVKVIPEHWGKIENAS